MAKFFRNLSVRMNHGPRTTDAQMKQAIDHFGNERSKLQKFKREFSNYTRAIQTFATASNHFFDFIQSTTHSEWTQHANLVQLCRDMTGTRDEHIQSLDAQINADLHSNSDKFRSMSTRIDDQDAIQRDYDKKRRHLYSSMESNDPTKSGQLQNEVDHLKSTLSLINRELRNDLPKFDHDLKKDYEAMITKLAEVHGRYYKRSYRTFSNFAQRANGKTSIDSKYQQQTSRTTEASSSSAPGSNYQAVGNKLWPRSKDVPYRILHEARVINDYDAEHDDEINLRKDEFISVIAFLDDENSPCEYGWEYAKKVDGTIGLFPVNFATRLYENEKEQ